MLSVFYRRNANNGTKITKKPYINRDDFSGAFQKNHTHINVVKGEIKYT